jgi:hypothetical protein
MKRCILIVYFSDVASTRGYSKGAVTLMAMNLAARPSRLTLPALLSPSTVEAFVLQSDQPNEAGLYSRYPVPPSHAQLK